MPWPAPLQPGEYYHLYNRGINAADLFYDDYDYWRFLDKYFQHTAQPIDTYAYCLMRNHFHLLIRVRTAEEQLEFIEQDPARVRDPGRVLSPSQQLAHVCNSHTQSVNHREKRTGSLFEKPFKRKLIGDLMYFRSAVTYIHWNPQSHGATDDFATYPYSSYGSFFLRKPSPLNQIEVLKHFGGLVRFEDYHRSIDLVIDEQLERD